MSHFFRIFEVSLRDGIAAYFYTSYFSRLTSTGPLRSGQGVVWLIGQPLCIVVDRWCKGHNCKMIAFRPSIFCHYRK